jgi:hypothetical protein
LSEGASWLLLRIRVREVVADIIQCSGRQYVYSGERFEVRILFFVGALLASEYYQELVYGEVIAAAFFLIV